MSHYNYNYNCTTPHYIQQLWVRWPLQPLQPLQKTQLQPPFGPSVDSLCHPWFTTANLSYRLPILKLLPPPCAVLLVVYHRVNTVQSSGQWSRNGAHRSHSCQGNRCHPVQEGSCSPNEWPWTASSAQLQLLQVHTGAISVAGAPDSWVRLVDTILTWYAFDKGTWLASLKWSYNLTIRFLQVWLMVNQCNKSLEIIVSQSWKFRTNTWKGHTLLTGAKRSSTQEMIWNDL